MKPFFVFLSHRNNAVNITFSEFPHAWGQNSIIARFEPSSDSEEIVILGSHQDSTAFLPFLRSPGADDDGSGCTALVTAFKALVEGSFRPSSPVEFHFYSAEEGGLLGSQAVSQAYARDHKVVKSMSQFDMSAWVKEGTEPTIGVITDFVSTEFSDFVKLIIEEYNSIGWKDTQCGYACSGVYKLVELSRQNNHSSISLTYFLLLLVLSSYFLRSRIMD